jgi:hypothetical protein
MRIRNHVLTNGKTVLEYIPENEEDREEVWRMMGDGEMPAEPSQSERKEIQNVLTDTSAEEEK